MRHPPDLDRFVSAQQLAYPRALAELRAGQKQSHWMWFIFPQIEGLSDSAMSQRYALAGLDEARAYLAHPLLGARLADCTDTMLGWAGRRDAEDILGAVDSLKFCSSMTLFQVAGGSARYGLAIDAFCGGGRDPRTHELLSATAARLRPGHEPVGVSTGGSPRRAAA